MSNNEPQRNTPIVAIATPTGKGAVGIVRISGWGLDALVQALCGRQLQPRKATHLPFLDENAEAIDTGLAIFFPAPHSFTGEDVLELQAHGGVVVLNMLVARCLQAAQHQNTLPNLQIAQPGEFTQRAFLNDKLDLAQAEAVADLIDATTEAAAKGATRSLSGIFSKEINVLLQQLIKLRMLVEATLDFPEEEIDFLQQADAKGQLAKIQSTLKTTQQRTQQGALLREGIKIVIAGQPNAGKSSLLNALAGAELAIVTPIAGTTRDKIEQTIQINGVPLHIIDTAGLRESDDVVEKIGIERAWKAIKDADAILFLHDTVGWQNTNVNEAIEHQKADGLISKHLQEWVSPRIPVLHIWNKIDAVSSFTSVHAAHLNAFNNNNADVSTNIDKQSKNHHHLSALTGDGLPALREALLKTAGWQHGATEGVYMARQRHIQALQAVKMHLDTAKLVLQQGNTALDILAEELRLAQNALGSITGEFGADDLLGVIFSQFCIGK